MTCAAAANRYTGFAVRKPMTCSARTRTFFVPKRFVRRIRSVRGRCTPSAVRASNRFEFAVRALCGERARNVFTSQNVLRPRAAVGLLSYFIHTAWTRLRFFYRVKFIHGPIQFHKIFTYERLRPGTVPSSTRRLVCSL